MSSLPFWIHEPSLGVDLPAPEPYLHVYIGINNFLMKKLLIYCSIYGGSIDYQKDYITLSFSPLCAFWFIEKATDIIPWANWTVISLTISVVYCLILRPWPGTVTLSCRGRIWAKMLISLNLFHPRASRLQDVIGGQNDRCGHQVAKLYSYMYVSTAVFLKLDWVDGVAKCHLHPQAFFSQCRRCCLLSWKSTQ